jgi:hypothetical protein
MSETDALLAVPATGDVYSPPEIDQIFKGHSVGKYDPVSGRTLTNSAKDGYGVILTAHGGTLGGRGYEFYRCGTTAAEINAKARKLLAFEY